MICIRRQCKDVNQGVLDNYDVLKWWFSFLQKPSLGILLCKKMSYCAISNLRIVNVKAALPRRRYGCFSGFQVWGLFGGGGCVCLENGGGSCKF